MPFMTQCWSTWYSHRWHNTAHALGILDN